MTTNVKRNTKPDASEHQLASGLFHGLCKQAYEKFCLHLADNRHTPAELFVVFNHDNGFAVRSAAAENASAHHRSFECAVEDISVDVRYGLAESPHLPSHLFKKLANYIPHVSRRRANLG